MSESPIAADDAKGRFVVDPYLDWANGEGIPIHQDFGLDLLGI